MAEASLNLYLIEYYKHDNSLEQEAAYVTASCIEDAIEKFRQHGFRNEIWHIVKSKVQHLIF